MTLYVCVCVCVCVYVYVCVCVCVCVCMEWLVAISLQSAGSLQKKEISMLRFLTDNLNLNELCVPMFFSTAWGTMTRIEPRNEW